MRVFPERQVFGKSMKRPNKINNNPVRFDSFVVQGKRGAISTRREGHG